MENLCSDRHNLVTMIDGDGENMLGGAALPCCSLMNFGEVAGLGSWEEIFSTEICSQRQSPGSHCKKDRFLSFHASLLGLKASHQFSLDLTTISLKAESFHSFISTEDEKQARLYRRFRISKYSRGQIGAFCGALHNPESMYH